MMTTIRPPLCGKRAQEKKAVMLPVTAGVRQFVFMCNASHHYVHTRHSLRAPVLMSLVLGHGAVEYVCNLTCHGRRL